jgi:hypothetical protein
MSRKYQIFTQYEFEHITSSRYWSQSNGKAKAAVKDAESVLKKSQDYHLALLNIRNPPPRGYSFSPAQRLMGRRTRSSLPLCGERLLPDPQTAVNQEITNHRAARFKFHLTLPALEGSCVHPADLKIMNFIKNYYIIIIHQHGQRLKQSGIFFLLISNY